MYLCSLTSAVLLVSLLRVTAQAEAMSTSLNTKHTMLIKNNVKLIKLQFSFCLFTAQAITNSKKKEEKVGGGGGSV